MGVFPQDKVVVIVPVPDTFALPANEDFHLGSLQIGIGSLVQTILPQLRYCNVELEVLSGEMVEDAFSDEVCDMYASFLKLTATLETPNQAVMDAIIHNATYGGRNDRDKWSQMNREHAEAHFAAQRAAKEAASE